MKLYPVFILSAMLLFTGICVCSTAAGQNISGIVNTYHRVTALNPATNALTLSSSAGLSPGTKVLIIQMKGATIDQTNTAAFGNITALNGAGNYEFNYVCGLSGNDVLLVYGLQKSYDVSGYVQLVTVPHYTVAVVTDTLKAQPWDASLGTGGIIAVEAVRSLRLEAPIDAMGAGFRGGAYVDHPQPPFNCDFSTNVTAFYLPNPAASAYATGGTKGEGITLRAAAYEFGKGKLANGGGGANNHNAGGAGGSNYAAGGGGGMRSNEGAFNCHGQNPGIGGLALSASGYTAADNRIFLGGGGGAGQGNNNVGMPGANGGGIIFLLTDTLDGNGQLIRANGAQPYRADLADPYSAGGDGGGGGGGGGVIILDVNTYTSNVHAQANGGRGSDACYTPSSGCFGPGGGGGGGVIWLKDGASNAMVNTMVTGGVNGVISMTNSVVACRGLANGAAAGSDGAVLNSYVRPVSTGLVCAPLPARDLQYFHALANGQNAHIEWKMRAIQGIARYEVERSADQVRFTRIATIDQNNRFQFTVSDALVADEYVYYRLKIVYANGAVVYSSVVLVRLQHNPGLVLLRLSPNPARYRLGLVVRAGMMGNCEMNVFNAAGRQVLTKHQLLRAGINNISFNLEQLPAGLYFLRARQGKEMVMAAFRIL